ncbi:polysaccharide pyruvyl transferase family protein [Ideonella livida]|uniref:Polysaccharide pyruvyl transferase family protein n=1 Tax=Ideonella livida TaxID=2707176 RepID=A0A7C9TKW6_9BURK|nr:polysaccharide pyruvyl transferase family protein [Ideonella livida]NDY92798.1 polysaccharide pyruvyl transferase family protein [Ideonella livida]
MAKSKTLKLFWWKGNDGVPNLGDELGPLLFERLFKLRVAFAGMQQCEAISVGSILGWPVKSGLLDKRSTPLHVLGSGFMHGRRMDVPAKTKVKVHFVRGALSHAKLDPDNPQAGVMGDLGLLTGDAVRPSTRRVRPYLLIPHHSRIQDPRYQAFVARHPGAAILDMRTADLDAACQMISQSGMVISQSLHGLVMSDALGVPNVWLRGETLHGGADFKFFDYFSSVGRPSQLSVSALDAPDTLLQLERNAFELGRATLMRLKDDLYRATEGFLANR